MVLVKVAVVVLFIVVGIWYIEPGNYKPFAPFGMSGVLQASAIAFFAYLGFDAVTSAAEEVKNPGRNLPVGILGSLAIVTVLYVVVSAIMVGIVPFKQFEGVDSPVSLALKVAGQDWVAGFVDLGAIVGMTTVILVMTFGLVRLLFAMSRDGLLPKVFSDVNEKSHTPVKATWILGTIAGLIAGFVPLGTLAELINIGTLAAFSLISIAVIVLRRTRPDLKRALRFRSSQSYRFCQSLLVSCLCSTYNHSRGLPSLSGQPLDYCCTSDMDASVRNSINESTKTPW